MRGHAAFVPAAEVRTKARQIQPQVRALISIVLFEEKRPVRLTAKQAPHRPGISSALGLRAEGDDCFILPQTEMEHTLMSQGRTIHRLVLLLALLTGIEFRYATAAAPTAYSIKDLGTLGGPFSTGLGINAGGQVMGYANTTLGEYRPFLYDGVMHDLGTLGGTSSAGWGNINDSGHVTGGSSTNSGDTHAFFYDGAMHDLGTLGGQDSDGRSINNSNQVTGSSALAGNSVNHAFLYNGVMHDLGTLGGTSSGGWGINDSGLITGYSYTRGDSAVRAFLYDGTMHDLGTLGTSSSDSSEGFGINLSGHVTGASYTTLAQHAFLYNGAMHDLGTLGGTTSTGQGINNSDQITGWSYTSTGETHAFLYTTGSGMVDLNSLIAPSAGWTLIRGWAINSDGQITGMGIIGDQQHAFLLSPVPEPAGLALVALGLPFLNIRRRTFAVLGVLR